MIKQAFWSDSAVRSVSAANTCDAYEDSGLVTASRHTCMTCAYNQSGGCHNVRTINMRTASLKCSEEPLIEAMFLV